VLDTFAFSIPLLPHHLAFWLKGGMDRYIVNHFHDSAAVGLYSLSFTFAAIINIVGTSFNSNNSVYMFKHLAGGYTQARPAMRRIARLMTLVFAGTCVVVCLGASVFIPIFVPKYAGSVVYLIPACIGAFFQCMYLLYVNYLFFYKKTRSLMYITFTTALLQLSLSLWLTRYSVLYTAWISCAVTALTFAGVYVKSKQILRRQLILEQTNEKTI
jgi:O-antigen/teichoic acid export membrane protein